MSRDLGPLMDEAGMMRALRALPARVPPPDLTTSLRVLASRERQRTQQHRTLATWWSAWMDRVNLAAQNMMRPFAVPFAGGVFSAVALFSTWVAATYPIRAAAGADVPTMLVTSAMLKGTSPVGASSADVVVEIVIDSRGRMVDYKVVQGAEILLNPSLRRGLENKLLFTQFVPATAFGKPKAGKTTLRLSSNRIDVKG
jgi:hypothetical protein